MALIILELGWLLFSMVSVEIVNGVELKTTSSADEPCLGFHEY